MMETDWFLDSIEWMHTMFLAVNYNYEDNLNYYRAINRPDVELYYDPM